MAESQMKIVTAENRRHSIRRNNACRLVRTENNRPSSGWQQGSCRHSGPQFHSEAWRKVWQLFLEAYGGLSAKIVPARKLLTEIEDNAEVSRIREALKNIPPD